MMMALDSSVGDWRRASASWGRQPIARIMRLTTIASTGFLMKMSVKSFTDIFIKKPVLAIVVSLMILAIGWRPQDALALRQSPTLESSAIIITTVYVGASAETVRGFITTPIEQAV